MERLLVIPSLDKVRYQGHDVIKIDGFAETTANLVLTYQKDQYDGLIQNGLEVRLCSINL